MAKVLKWLVGVVAGLAVIAAVLWFTPTGDYVILPGVTENLNQVVHVQGVRKAPPGRMLMVAVDIQQANLLYYLIGKYTPYGEVMPASELLGTDVSEAQYEQMNQQLMSESHLMAKVAALRAIGLPARETGKGVLVYATEQGTPAAGKLKANDVITAVDGHAMQIDQQLLNFMGTVKPGTPVDMTVRRKGKTLHVVVGTVPSTDLKGHAMVGALIGTLSPGFVVPLKIKISTGSISGPSAGMMFSLSIIDQLRPQWHLTHGNTVAGTGTIDAFGDVGAIGGIKEKVVTVFDSGAKVFLVPRGDYADAVAEARALGITNKMRIIPVGTLDQALTALRRS
jgi:PDZ domain-containing protein